MYVVNIPLSERNRNIFYSSKFLGVKQAKINTLAIIMVTDIYPGGKNVY